jgi:hypothetical protein
MAELPCLAAKQLIQPHLLPFKKNIAGMADLINKYGFY